MPKHLVVLVSVCFAVACLGLAGCGEGDNSGASADQTVKAYNIRDDAPKFYDMQQTCPVCGQKPIKKDVFVDHQGKRIYFDRQECADQFESAPDEHLQEWFQRLREEGKRKTMKMRKKEMSE